MIMAALERYILKASSLFVIIAVQHLAITGQYFNEDSSAASALENSKEIDMNGFVKRYMILENVIQNLEKKKTRQSLKRLKEQETDTAQTIEWLEKSLIILKEQTKKEKADVEDAKLSTMKDQESNNTKMSAEKSEYMGALVEEKNTKEQLNGAKKQRDEIMRAMRKTRVLIDKLDMLEKEQDELLGRIFNGHFGGDIVNRLESEHNLYQHQKQKINTTFYKWSSCEVLSHHATRQMTKAESWWNEVANMPVLNRQLQYRRKYKLATKTRANLISVVQNIKLCQRYLDNVTFPYCDEDAVQTLEKTIENIYIDMITPERIVDNTKYFHAMRHNVSALENWNKNIINTVIRKDLEKTKKLEKKSGLALKAERIRLIKEMLENYEEMPGENALFDTE